MDLLYAGTFCWLNLLPYMAIVIVCMVLMYIWPGMTLWLPEYLYGSR